LNKNKNKFKFVKLLNGYKQFDPTRGANYILDLIVSKSDVKLNRRVQLFRPLGRIEFIPMGFASEEAKLYLVIPFLPSLPLTQTQIVDFFEMFQRLSFDNVKNVNLFIVHLIPSNYFVISSVFD
jgi:hypothetical protein